MTTKEITVNQGVFHCPIDWTVEQAETRIRSRFGLQNGGIEQDNVSVLGTVSISSLTGSLAFVGGSQADAGGSTVVNFASAEGKMMLDVLIASFKDIVHEEVREGIRQFAGSSGAATRGRGSNDTTVVGEYEATAKEDSK